VEGVVRLALRAIAVGLSCALLVGCEALTQRAPAEPSPLVIAACPPLQPLGDDSFGATTLKLIEVAIQYRKCRAAALAE
jgi:hypothetical protein